jgi:hypothetical protein
MATDRWGQWPSQMPRWTDQVKMLTGPSDDVMHHRSSQVAQELEDLDRIMRDGLVHRLQKNQVSRTVPTPLIFGQRSFAGGELTRRQETVYGDSELRATLSTKKGVQRCASSPGFFLEGQRRRLSMEVSSVSPIPARCCGKERLDLCCPLLPFSIPSSQRFDAARC